MNKVNYVNVHLPILLDTLTAATPRTMHAVYCYHVYQLGTGGCTQKAKPVRGAYP